MCLPTGPSAPPLAVVLDAGGLSTAQMQAIASEFNYSETTFVLPPRDSAHDTQVRIFTVNNEIPFAGHPNVATAFVLATQASKPVARFLFEEIAGLVPVDILKEDDNPVGAELTAPQPLKKLTSLLPRAPPVVKAPVMVLCGLLAAKMRR
jgi:trans-2,3-dihydro-3-hydroxyanthranilate isomerase